MKIGNILITGCSSGIGYAVAKGLRAHGYRVFATTRKAIDAERLRAEGLESVQLDLDDSHSIAHAVDYVLEQTHGELHALFNNGAYGQPGAVEDLSREVLRRQFESNFFGWHELTCKVLPIMRKQGYGRIIQNSSVLGLVALPFRGAYNASKFALEGLSDTLRLELQGTGIYVSLIEPGPIISRFRANAYAMLQKNIDTQNSPHWARYVLAVQRLSRKEGDEPRFTLPPEAILKPLLHALQNDKPRPRYYVTVPTYFLGTVKRVLSSSLLDKLLLKISRAEHRQQ